MFSFYVVAFDVFSDIVVIFYFINDNGPIFAALQMLFIIAGQVVGAITDVLGDRSGNASRTDLVMALLGYGRIWFGVNAWKETASADGMRHYKVLSKKHKIWELMYETFPTVALQIYAVMTIDVPVWALVLSITLSAVKVSYSSISYLQSLLKVTLDSKDEDKAVTDKVKDYIKSICLKEQSDSKDGDNSEERPSGNILYFILFMFMVSDFYIRSIPSVMWLAVISEKWIDEEQSMDKFWRFFSGTLLFGGLAAFEFVANRQIRQSHRDLWSILKIFAVSIFSSFHSMLSTVSVLKDDTFYAESLIFSKYLVEHGIRCGVAFILCIFSVAVGGTTLWYPWFLSGIFLLCLVINGVSVHRICNSDFDRLIPEIPRKMHVSQVRSQSTIELQTAGQKESKKPDSSSKPESAGDETLESA